MGAQSLLTRLSTSAFVPSFKDFQGSLSDTAIPCFLLPTKWSSMPADQKYGLSTCRIRTSRRQFLCSVSSRKVEDTSDNLAQCSSKPSRKRLAVFVSGGGSNFKAIHEATLNGSVLGDVVVLVTNKEGCGGAAYAKENGIPVVLFPRTKEESQQFLSSDLVTTLRELEVDFILLAGYLKLIPVELVQHFPKRILNIHPSLLPAFGGKGYYGLTVHKAVIASGARYSGPTIHFVDEEYDTGRILAQRVVPVCAFDTPEELAARVLHEEHLLYVDVVAAVCEDRIIWRDDGVPLIQSKEDPQQYN
ncbi:phosphoribosylglycinamide formyltransferase, chloroplastic-like [Chenopodium quinoa]|uniref:phosphoribosylglycinamide formyltransferase, chloroplastic-like n=1 Tax=Chenopodium quinoa TaxID=63459 RepID=UPI000B78DC1B|nr:phosphoribosylglycinamide formyltransferase, chloroplastic-like [Chenopodium quinoa]XP_021737387.1 phosphoribosylglycinamide formyltransferase, chloroplastic-like [Chenopodium quinoa]